MKKLEWDNKRAKTLKEFVEIQDKYGFSDLQIITLFVKANNLEAKVLKNVCELAVNKLERDDEKL